MKKLGTENAKKVIAALGSKPQQFGFIKASEEWLSQLEALPVPPYTPVRNDVFCFRAGVWFVTIVVNEEWVEVHLNNPYDMTTDHYVASNL